MGKRWVKFLAFLVVIFVLSIWLAIASANVDRENFQHYFEIIYSPDVSKQPQAEFAVLKGLLRLRSQCKNTVRQKIKIDMAIEEMREVIVNSSDQSRMSQGHYMIELLKERARLLEEKKERRALFIRACRLADNKNFTGAYEAAECGIDLSVDVIALANEVREMQQ